MSEVHTQLVVSLRSTEERPASNKETTHVTFYIVATMLFLYWHQKQKNAAVNGRK